MPEPTKEEIIEALQNLVEVSNFAHCHLQKSWGLDNIESHGRAIQDADELLSRVD